MDQAEADAFARRWIEDWNSHDLDVILGHWDDDVVFTSPLAARLMGDPSGTVRGKDALRAYWARGLAANPDLHFVLDTVYVGHDSVVIGYTNEHGHRCAELVVFGPAGQAVRGAGHYVPAR